MTRLEAVQAARAAVATSAERPATAILHDAADARLVVFRLAPGQAVPPHRNASTVILTVLAGEGVLSGGDGAQPCRAGDVVVYAPDELHGMRADDAELLLLATITPRPGGR
jgi:quercetin dioxygenase-like cupin family protein